MLVLTVDNAAATERTLTSVRNFNRGLPVQARARDLEHADRLLELGATHVALDVVDASLTFGERVLLDLGVPQDDVDELIENYRKNEYAALRRSG